MAKITWNGAAVMDEMVEATKFGIDETMSLCVGDAVANHPAGPEPSEPGERFHNQTGHTIGDIRINAGPDGIAGAGLDEDGLTVRGVWGANAEDSLFLEIGTSVSGPTATEREDAAEGNMDAIAPPEGPLMAARPFLRPAKDKFYSGLAGRIAEARKEMG